VPSRRWPPGAQRAGRLDDGRLSAPNDGKKRQLKARHVADGCTASAYTVAVTVLPWTILPLPPITDSDATTLRVVLSTTVVRRRHRHMVALVAVLLHG
jgi:hypothetical protein